MLFVPARPPRRAVLTGALAATLSAGLAGCARDGGAGGTGAAAAALRVGPLTTQNTLSLALASGLLERHLADAGRELSAATPFAAFAPAAEALAARRIDAGSGSSTALVAALRGGPGPVVFAVEVDEGASQGIVATGGSGVRTLADLAGRSVAVNEGGTGDYLLRLALEREGMTVDDVRPVHLGPPDAATAFASGQVDAWATWDQYLATAQAQPGTATLALARDIGAANRTVHVVHREFLDADPVAVRAAHEALVEQAAAVAADRRVLVDAYTAAGASAEIAEAVAAQGGASRVVPADEAFREELQGVADFYAAQGLTPTATDVGGAVVDVTTLA
ncbi:ABC transporter substrate-binding protein [Kineococcus sp. SYSU DK004]|uniref:ABC transporter substrate-binding protein n=1 Tax=Kineococcus sp. SYSU DK004 TaxID=3383125 RepID=UPI003D7E147E